MLAVLLLLLVAVNKRSSPVPQLLRYDPITHECVCFLQSFRLSFFVSLSLLTPSLVPALKSSAALQLVVNGC